MALIPFQTDCNEDMAGIMDKLRSLKHNISGVAEPTQQIFNKFVIEESLKWVKKEFLRKLCVNWIWFFVIDSSEWKSAIRDKKCPCQTNSVARAKHLIERLRVSWDLLFETSGIQENKFISGFVAALITWSRYPIVDL